MLSEFWAMWLVDADQSGYIARPLIGQNKGTLRTSDKFTETRPTSLLLVGFKKGLKGVLNDIPNMLQPFALIGLSIFTSTSEYNVSHKKKELQNLI